VCDGDNGVDVLEKLRQAVAPPRAKPRIIIGRVSGTVITRSMAVIAHQDMSGGSIMWCVCACACACVCVCACACACACACVCVWGGGG
jgi:hypothetical protein